jgi:hypothetical protein
VNLSFSDLPAYPIRKTVTLRSSEREHCRSAQPNDDGRKYNPIDRYSTKFRSQEVSDTYWHLSTAPP